jgi:uncharacterized protein YqgV (UPF0045/DUF77 family)
VNEQSDIKTAVDFTREMSAPQFMAPAGAPTHHFVFVPKGYETKDVSAAVDERVEAMGSGPRTIVDKLKAETLLGFCDYVNRHKAPNTAISARGGERPSLVGTLDYHVASAGEGPVSRWCEHTIEYPFPFSRQFKAWQAAGSWKDKKAFLEFVDVHAIEIVSPEEIELPGAEPDIEKDLAGWQKWENAQSTWLASVTRRVYDGVLRAKGYSTQTKRDACLYRATEQRDNGEGGVSTVHGGLSVVYGEPHDLLVGARAMSGTSTEALEEDLCDFGTVSIKYTSKQGVVNAVSRQYFLVEMPVFEGDAPQCVPVRLHAHVEGGKLHLRLELQGVETLLERAFDRAVAVVKEATGIAPIRAVF